MKHGKPKKSKAFFRLTGMAMLLLALGLPLYAMQSLTEMLQRGSSFPVFSGRTISNRQLTLPPSHANKPTVLVFSFSRMAGKDARSWNESLTKDFPDSALTYGVIQLESAPKIFHGLAINGMKSSMPPAIQDRTIVLYRDEALWRKRLEVTDKNRAYVILLDRAGTIRWMSSDGYSNMMYGLLKAQIAELLRASP